MEILTTIAALLGFVALTAGTALFVAAEFSLTALERSTVEAHATDGDAAARRVRFAHSTLSFQLSGAQLGITLTTLITGFLAEPVLARFVMPVARAAGLGESVASTVSLITALVIATSLSMILGELAPKNAAIAHPLTVARITAAPMTAFSWLFAWAIRGLNGLANRLVRLMGIEPADELASARSPRELSALVRASAAEGSLEGGMAELVDRSLRFGALSAEDLMTPRSTIAFLDLDDTVRDLIEAAARTGHSRFPVADGDLDVTHGVVHIKQAFEIPDAERATTRLARLVQKVPSVPDSLDGDSVLEEVRASGRQVALVVDEYGGTAGMITMEDIVEEIVGDVRDEHDRPELQVIRRRSGWICAGLLRVDEIERATGYRAPEGDYETLGGLVMTSLGRIPRVGDQLVLPRDENIGIGDLSPASGHWSARVLRMDGRRVDAVVISPITSARAEIIRAEQARGEEDHDG